MKSVRKCGDLKFVEGYMAQKKIPTVEELREYIAKEKEYLKDCIEKDKDRGSILLRNIKVLERSRSFLTPMKKKLEEAQNCKDNKKRTYYKFER